MNSAPLSASKPFAGNAAKSLWFFIPVFGLVVAIIACCGWLFYLNREKTIREEKEAELSAIADMKAEQIINWRNERFTDVAIINGDAFVLKFLEKRLKSPNDTASQIVLLSWLANIEALEHYRSVFLTDVYGKTLLTSSLGRGLRIEPGCRAFFDSALSRRCPVLSDLHRDGAGENDVHCEMIVPLVAKSSRDTAVLGALVLDIDPGQFLYPLIQSWPMPSRTAEVLLVRKEENDIVFLNELRHRKNTALTLRLSAGDKNLPAARAVSGFTGAMEGIDYRGVAVLAVARAIPGTHWFMVAKMDKSEAFAATRLLFARAVVLIVLLILLAGAVAALLLRQRSSMVYKRMYLAEKEKAGLSVSLAEEKERLLVTLRSIGDGVITTDTKGIVTLMNSVAEQLTGFSAAEAFGKPLVEIFHIIHEHTRERCENPVEKVMKSGLIIGLANHTALISRDGTERIIADSGAPIRDAQGNVIGVVLVFRDITKKKQAEEALKKSEERFRTLTDAAFEGVCLVEKGLVIDVNDQLLSMFSFTRGEVVGKPVQDFVAPGDRTKVALAMQQGTPGASELHAIRKGGEEFPVEVRGRTMQAGGRSIRVTAILDISERRKAELALRESEARLKRAELASKSGNWELHLDSQLMKGSDGALKIYGVDSDTLSFQIVKDIPLPEYRPMLDAALAGLMKNGTPYDVEFKIKTVDTGEIKDVHSVAVFDRKKSVLFGAIQDITTRKRAEQALAAEKERLAVTLRSIGDAVIATNILGNIVLMNKVAETLTGWPFAEAEGKPLGEVFHTINQLTREPCANPVEKVLASGSVVTLENHTVLVGRDGSELVIADSGAPIRDRDSKTIGVVLVFRDNTERQRAQAAMQKAEQLESLGVLAGGIAHDFNNLLSGLFGYLDLTREVVKKNDAASQYLEKAFSVFGRAKDLTSQLLTFAKGGAPAKKTKPLAPLVRDAVHFALSGSTVKSRFEIARDLWNCDIDENQMGQVLDNIVINARDAMPMGGTITVSAENVPEGSGLPPVLAPGNYVRLSVADQGTGIAPEHLPRIFDPFFTTKQKGSGLGLATSYSIVKRHEGLIAAESELGKGSTFIIYLPASQKSVGRETRDGAGAGHQGSGRVLVMDDEDFVRDVASAMVRNMGYTAETAEHGAAALDAFNRAREAGRPFDLVILDLTIPGGMGGTETKDALRKIAPPLKIMASSGYSDDPIMSHPKEYGFDASVRKPYDMVELAAALARVMKG